MTASHTVVTRGEWLAARQEVAALNEDTPYGRLAGATDPTGAAFKLVSD